MRDEGCVREALKLLIAPRLVTGVFVPRHQCAPPGSSGVPKGVALCADSASSDVTGKASDTVSRNIRTPHPPPLLLKAAQFFLGGFVEMWNRR